MSTPDVHHSIAQTRFSQLQQRTEAFCNAFLNLGQNPPDKILSDHFILSNPKITEHGPEWASERLPFLGKTFSGRDGCLEYFHALSETLEFLPHKNTFPGNEGFIVDDKADGSGTENEHQYGKGLVSVVGQATFKAVKTGKQWEEKFIYRLSGFDEDGKIGHWEVWADPLSAWMAVSGETV